LLNVNRACQPCHAVAEAELAARVATIQDRHHTLLQRAATAATDMLDAIVAAKQAGATDAQLAPARALQRKAQWRLDFVAAENSMGFHAPQELARILAETIDYARRGRAGGAAGDAAAPAGGAVRPAVPAGTRAGRRTKPDSRRTLPVASGLYRLNR
jgi:nitrite reductase (cytochrome c-552)